MENLTRSRKKAADTVSAPFRFSQPAGGSGGHSLRVLPKAIGRRPAAAVASIAVVATCSALFALIYLHSSRLVSEIAVTHEVLQGEPIEGSDLRQADVALSGGVSGIPVSDAGQVIGRPAAVTLVAGTLLSPSDVGSAAALPSGQSVVGMDLKPGMLPASGVEPGESVLVVLTGPAGTPVAQGVSTRSANSEVSGQSNDVTAATVVGVDTSPDDSGSGDVVVSVQVPLAIASLVANWSAAAQVALVQVGGPS